MVEVEQAPLGALEEHAFALGDPVEQQGGGVTAIGGEALGPAAAEVGDAGGVRHRLAAQRPQLGLQAQHLRSQALLEVWRSEVTQAHAHARSLDLVGGTDAAHRGADLAGPGGALALGIELDLLAEDQVRALGNEESPLDFDAHALEPLDLGEEGLRIDDHAVAEQAIHSRA